MKLQSEGKPTADPLQKYNDQLSSLGVRLADKLLTVPMEKLAQSKDNPAKAYWAKGSAK